LIKEFRKTKDTDEKLCELWMTKSYKKFENYNLKSEKVEEMKT